MRDRRGRHFPSSRRETHGSKDYLASLCGAVTVLAAIAAAGEIGPVLARQRDSGASVFETVRSGEFSERVRELTARGEPFAMATVVRTEGSTLARRGFKLLIAHDGKVVGGTFGGGCPEGPVVELALSAMRDGESRVVRIHLVDAKEALAGMARDPSPEEIWVETDCGGTLEVHVEPMLPSERLVLVGQGGKDDVEEALVDLGTTLGFEVVVVDPSPQLRAKPHRLIAAAVPEPSELGLGGHDSVVVLTKGERDVAVLRSLAVVPTRYVGLLASHRRAQKDRDELRALGVPDSFLARLRTPIGIDIGARSPAEIAVSILAEVLATKYGRSAVQAPGERTAGAAAVP
jgi:xanthine dehydrogenase accessory factor